MKAMFFPSVADKLLAPAMRAGMPLDFQIKYDASVSACGTFRWKLTRFFGESQIGGGAVLPWIMLNPSTADGRVDDPTLKRIIGFSWRWGFDGLVVVNLYPYRSSKPSALRAWLHWDEWADWAARDAIWENQARVANDLESFDAAMAAWGSPVGAFGNEVTLGAKALLDTVNDPERGGRDRVLKLFCLGTAQNGDPKHPMARGIHRVPEDARPVPLPRYPGSIVGLGDEVRA